MGTSTTKEGYVTTEISYSQWCREEILSLQHQLEKENIWNPVQPPLVRNVSYGEGKANINRTQSQLSRNINPKLKTAKSCPVTPLKDKETKEMQKISMGMFMSPKIPNLSKTKQLEIARTLCWMSANI